MNSTRKFKSLRLVHFGDIVYDQQRRLIMLCRSCHSHYLSMEVFEAHLSSCIGLKHIVDATGDLKYDEKKREKRLIHGQQELLIYEPHEVSNANSRIDWEAELEDPRWYTSSYNNNSTTQSLNKPTQKENMSKLRTRYPVYKKSPVKEPQIEQNLSPQPEAKRMRHSIAKRAILTNQQQTATLNSPELPTASLQIKSNNVRRPVPPKTPTKPTTNRAGESAGSSPSSPVSIRSNGATQQILEKLRGFGVEVKRHNTRQALDAGLDPATAAKKEAALAIMHKLQSKGIKCTKVNNIKQ